MMMQRMIHELLDGKGDSGAGDILRKASAQGEVSRDLAYRLYTVCEHKGWSRRGRRLVGWHIERRVAGACEGDVFEVKISKTCFMHKTSRETLQERYHYGNLYEVQHLFDLLREA